MKDSSYRDLQYGALLALVDKFAFTPEGHARLRSLLPCRDGAILDAALNLACEATEYMRALARAQAGVLRLDFGGLGEMAPILAQLRIEGTSLEPGAVSITLALLDRASDFKEILGSVRERFPALHAVARKAGDFRPLLHELAGKILPDGSLDDRASPALHRLRREITAQQAAIQQSLERFLREYGEEGVLQEELITIRSDRYVVPVKTGMKRRINGVVHGSSSTGQTVFVEPMATIELNNELVSLREQELQEVHRILLEMTSRLRARLPDIEDSSAVMIELDVAFAKGAFALEFDACIPHFTTGRLQIKNARHPVLMDVLRSRKNKVVPLSLELDQSNRILVISGPNAGGKTVVLKTVGLLALAAQSGIPVTAEEAEFPLFDQVLADIGDYQSIEANLSTFSAHLTNIEAMAEQVTPQSLVLLDELGGSTDPQEGGALAVAVVDYFRDAGAFTLASTHHLALKVYATNTEGVVNASVGFDEATLQPTYKLLAGVPGKSSGLDIAQRLGLKPEILARARQALTSQDEEVGQFLARLHTAVEEAEQLRDEARRREEELRDQTRQVAAQWEKREKAKIAELEKQLAALIERMETEAREALRQITEKPARRQAERRLTELREEVREQFDSAVVEQLGAAPEAAAPPKLEAVREGMTVRLRGFGRNGVVRRKISDDMFEVEMGLLKIRARASEMEAAPAASPAPPPKTIELKTAMPAVSSEINVIGCTAEEARERVDKFLDTAALAAIPRVRVVHGHGKGVLRKTLAEMFAAHPHVERHYPAEQREGGTGATIVELKV